MSLSTRRLYLVVRAPVLVETGTHAPLPVVSLQSLKKSTGFPLDRIDNIDEARLRPHLRERSRQEERARLERDQAGILKREYARAVAEGRDTTMPVRPGEAGGDYIRMRGIPMLARGVPGTSPHTQPESEVVARLMRATRAA